MAQDAFSMMTETPAMAFVQGPRWKPADSGSFDIDEATGDYDHRHIEDIERLPHGALPGVNKGTLCIANPDVFPRGVDRDFRPPKTYRAERGTVKH